MTELLEEMELLRSDEMLRVELLLETRTLVASGLLLETGVLLGSGELLGAGVLMGSGELISSEELLGPVLLLGADVLLEASGAVAMAAAAATGPLTDVKATELLPGRISELLGVTELGEAEELLDSMELLRIAASATGPLGDAALLEDGVAELICDCSPIALELLGGCTTATELVGDAMAATELLGDTMPATELLDEITTELLAEIARRASAAGPLEEAKEAWLDGTAMNGVLAGELIEVGVAELLINGTTRLLDGVELLDGIELLAGVAEP